MDSSRLIAVVRQFDFAVGVVSAAPVPCSLLRHLALFLSVAFIAKMTFAAWHLSDTRWIGDYLFRLPQQNSTLNCRFACQALSSCRLERQIYVFEAMSLISDKGSFSVFTSWSHTLLSQFAKRGKTTCFYLHFYECICAARMLFDFTPKLLLRSQ